MRSSTERGGISEMRSKPRSISGCSDTLPAEVCFHFPLLSGR